MKGLKCILVCLLIFSACSTISEQEEKRLINIFARTIFDEYYLWKEELSDSLALWDFNASPDDNVDRCLYRDSDGKLVDKWSGLEDRGSGSPKIKYGFSYCYCTFDDTTDNQEFMVVTRVSPGSAADKAGLRRGDRILDIDEDTLKLADRTVLLEKPLDDPGPCVISNTFTVGNTKVGYMYFDEFDDDNWEPYVSAIREFKESGISDLVLDLRYNLGGYSNLADFLASIIVQEEHLFDIFIHRGPKAEKCFMHEYLTYYGKVYETVDLNLGIEHLYIIYSGDSASASEYLYVGLKPYMDITTIGEKTYGKFYGGLDTPMEWYLDAFKDKMTARDYRKGKKIADGKGLYIITYAYTDCDFANPYVETGGILPDIPVTDNPLDGYQLGDMRETMLRAALDAIGGKPVEDAGLPSGFTKYVDSDRLTNFDH